MGQVATSISNLESAGGSGQICYRGSDPIEVLRDTCVGEGAENDNNVDWRRG